MKIRRDGSALTRHLLQCAQLRQQVVLRLGQCERALQDVARHREVVEGPVHTAEHGQELRHQLVVAQLLVGHLEAPTNLEPANRPENRLAVSINTEHL
jgi:hypothetical protein